MLRMHARARLEALGLKFEPETTPPFSWGGGPVASTGIRLPEGTEYWLWADWLWDHGEFSTPTLDSTYHAICVNAAPAQFGEPVKAAEVFLKASEIPREDVTWMQSEWLTPPVSNAEG